jgi:hypothetical protein
MRSYPELVTSHVAVVLGISMSFTVWHALYLPLCQRILQAAECPPLRVCGRIINELDMPDGLWAWSNYGLSYVLAEC